MTSTDSNRSPTQQQAGPLSGLRVLDVSIMAAGPWTGALLGMLGADVIKVEQSSGDYMRGAFPISISPWGRRGPMISRKGSELTAQAMAG